MILSVPVPPPIDPPMPEDPPPIIPEPAPSPDQPVVPDPDARAR